MKNQEEIKQRNSEVDPFHERDLRRKLNQEINGDYQQPPVVRKNKYLDNDEASSRENSRMDSQMSHQPISKLAKNQGNSYVVEI